MKKLIAILLISLVTTASAGDQVTVAIKTRFWSQFKTKFQATFARGVGKGAEWDVFGIPATWVQTSNTNTEYYVTAFWPEQLTQGTNSFDEATMKKVAASWNNPSGRGYMATTNDVQGWLKANGLEPKNEDL